MIDHFIGESYFKWLQSETFPLKADQREYEGVLRVLHDIPFMWVLPLDDNRSGDAITFRQYEFIDCMQIPKDLDPVALGQWATAAPSVLEVILGCGRRWLYYYGAQSVPFYFGHMFRGLDLQNFPGRQLEPDVQHQIREIIDRWLNRQFEPNGHGSPWPLTGSWYAYEDQRRVDMWAQMNAYSAEHFQ